MTMAFDAASDVSDEALMALYAKETAQPPLP